MLDLRPITTVLFDVDGTLLNTFEFIYGSFEHAFQTHGLPQIDRVEISRHMGGPLEECYRSLVPGCDSHVLAETHRSFQSENLHLATRFPATIEVLEHLQSKDYRLGAVTTRSLRTSVRSMESTSIAHYFDVIVSGEDVTNVKPHPEPVLKALAALRSEPSEAVMIGDTIADIQSGKGAGTMTIAALYGFGGETLRAARADLLIHDLSELRQLL